jgi:hypothetical protein
MYSLAQTASDVDQLLNLNCLLLSLNSQSAWPDLISLSTTADKLLLLLLLLLLPLFPYAF